MAGVAAPSPDSPLSLIFSRASPTPSTFRRRYLPMAAQPAADSPADEEPSSKHRRIEQNGALPLLRVKRLSLDAVLPSRATLLSAGYDLFSAADATVPARGKALIPTGLAISVPPGTYGRVAPRSGLACRHSIDIGAGVIDADYRGPVGVVLFNHGDADFPVTRGDRVAQLVLQRIATPDVMEVDELDETARGVGGFGSTGV